MEKTKSQYKTIEGDVTKVDKVLQQNERARALGFSTIEYRIEDGELVAQGVKMSSEKNKDVLFIGTALNKVDENFRVPSEITTIHIANGALGALRRSIAQYTFGEILRYFETSVSKYNQKHKSKRIGGIVLEGDVPIPVFARQTTITFSSEKEYNLAKQKKLLEGYEFVLKSGGVDVETKEKREYIDTVVELTLRDLAPMTIHYLITMQNDYRNKSESPTLPKEEFVAYTKTWYDGYKIFKTFLEIAAKVAWEVKCEDEFYFSNLFAERFLLEMLNYYGEIKFSDLDRRWYSGIVKSGVLQERWMASTGDRVEFLWKNLYRDVSADIPSKHHNKWLATLEHLGLDMFKLTEVESIPKLYCVRELLILFESRGLDVEKQMKENKILRDILKGFLLDTSYSVADWAYYTEELLPSEIATERLVDAAKILLNLHEQIQKGSIKLEDDISKKSVASKNIYGKLYEIRDAVAEVVTINCLECVEEKQITKEVLQDKFSLLLRYMVLLERERNYQNSFYELRSAVYSGETDEQIKIQCERVYRDLLQMIQETELKYDKQGNMTATYFDILYYVKVLKSIPEGDKGHTEEKQINIARFKREKELQALYCKVPIDVNAKKREKELYYTASVNVEAEKGDRRVKGGYFDDLSDDLLFWWGDDWDIDLD